MPGPARSRRLLLALGWSVAGAIAHGQDADAPPPRAAAADFVAARSAAPPPAPVAAALQGIDARALAAHVAFLASPALEGRGLGSRGLDAAAEYAAASLSLAGIPPLGQEPAGRGALDAYFQPVPLQEVGGFTGTVTVGVQEGGATRRLAFASGADCLFLPAPPRRLTAPIVFAGYGIHEPALGHDDYAGLDVRGKVVILLRGAPPGEVWRVTGLVARYDAGKPADRWEAKLQAAQALGARAVLALEGEDFAADAAEEPPSPRVFVPSDVEEPPLVARMSPAAGRALLAVAGVDRNSPAATLPRELRGVTVTVETGGAARSFSARNVVGFLAGSDPAARDEAVLIGAHLDHLGRSGDVIYPGADDNASGVSALVEVVRAFAALPYRPRRTVVFAFWSGEEEGKLGSGHYVRRPRWPLARTVAYLNLDMIGHPWQVQEIRTLVAEARLAEAEAFLAATAPADFAEPGLPLDAPRLEEALRWAGAVTGMALHLDRTDGTRGGSDYRPFARARVPFIRFFGNFFPAYHQPGDTAESLDAQQVRRMARLAFATAWRLADH